MKNKITTVVFDQETISRLKSIARRNNKSTSFLIREAVTEYLGKKYPGKT
ncbi:MAG: ribbon-helix-helix protein, CopG family [Actinomycetota bacterium]|nr:ribbon-helix-helix protein, CopG family [Actinomycetota bacterium]